MDRTLGLLSVVTPMYDEEDTAREFYARVVAALDGVDFELVVVDDGSKDGTAAILQELAAADDRVKVVLLSRNFGHQPALTAGLEHARGDAVVMIDSDLQDPPELIPELVERWREGYDVVYGERVDREGRRLMRWAYKRFYRLLRRVSYIDVPVDAGDFGLMDRRAVDVVNELPEKQRFLRGLRAWVGFRQTGVPYVRPERMFGVSTNSLRKNFGWARRAIVSFSYAPLDFIISMALLVVGASALALLVSIGLKIAFPSVAPKGATTLIVLVLFIGGMQLLCISIVGSYLAAMFEEVKSRPAYVVDEILNDPAQRPPSARREQEPAERVANTPRHPAGADP